MSKAGTLLSKTHEDPEDPDTYVDLLWYSTLSAAAVLAAAEEYLIASKVKLQFPEDLKKDI